MSLVEINFDGLVGPSHNYAGLSAGNLASQSHGGQESRPRAAALQGLAKMRANLDLGLAQGLFVPLARPNRRWLADMAAGDDAPAHLTAIATSASSMWAANAATVSPAPDTSDGRCHLTVANLLTMPHRAHEWTGTLAQLRVAFADPAFAVHGPVPAPFGDEGAANHMRLTPRHGAAGVEVFVYGVAGGPFPARQQLEASQAVARRHGVDAIMAQQSVAAIAAGAFHNDVVAVANEHVLFAHEQAFEQRGALYDALSARLPELTVVEVPAAEVSLADAIASYLFNAQLVTLPDGTMALIVPAECREVASVAGYLDRLTAGNGPIRQVIHVDVRESMANGGGPACLRLRVVADPATIDPRFMLDHPRLDALERLVASHWPETLQPSELSARAGEFVSARDRLLEHLQLAELA